MIAKNQEIILETEWKLVIMKNELKSNNRYLRLEGIDHGTKNEQQKARKKIEEDGTLPDLWRKSLQQEY